MDSDPFLSFMASVFACFLQEGYISQVKALLGKELSLENGSHVDGAEQNGKTNGFTNGSHKDEDSEDVAMEVPEEEEALKSPTASKGKGGRKSKSNSDTPSNFEALHYKFILFQDETTFKANEIQSIKVILFFFSQHQGYKKWRETAHHHVHVLQSVSSSSLAQHLLAVCNIST